MLVNFICPECGSEEPLEHQETDGIISSTVDSIYRTKGIVELASDDEPRVGSSVTLGFYCTDCGYEVCDYEGQAIRTSNALLTWLEERDMIEDI